MKHLIWPVLQVGLLVAWYTVAPQLPWWLVFLPMLVSGAALVVFLGILAVALCFGVTNKRIRFK